VAKWESLAVEKVVQGIREDKFVLPVIQRSLVWNEDKMELLFDSLLKDNSFGGIMVLDEEKGEDPLFAFRRFSREGEEQHSVVQQKLDQSISLVIDGQQRLQAFYMGLEGGYRGKAMYFNLYGTPLEHEFQFAHDESELPLEEPDDGEGTVEKLWYPVRTLFSRLRKVGDDIQVANEIIAARGVTDDGYRDAVKANVARFHRYVSYRDTIGISSVTVNKTRVDEEKQRIVELFRRLNAGATRLSPFDLVAARFKGFDYRMEGFFGEVRQFEDMDISQDEVIKLVFLLRDEHTKEVTDIEAEDAKFVIENRERIIQSLRTLRKFLEYARLYDYYRSGGRAVIPLYFIAYHVFHKDPSTTQLDKVYDNYDAKNEDFLSLKRWMYLSLLNGVFSRGVGWIPYRTGIRKILNALKGYKRQVFPSEAIFQVYRNHPLRFSADVTTERLDLWDHSFVFYLMYGCQSLSGRDIDHVHPRSRLEGADVAPHKIHSIANFQLLDEGTNRNEKRAKTLKGWLEGGGVSNPEDYLERHLIPQEQAKWEIAQFDAFLEKRSAAICDRVSAAIPDPVPQPERSVAISTAGEALPGRDSQDTGHPELDRAALMAELSPDVSKHRILEDNSDWFHIFRQVGYNPVWSGRYRSGLASLGIHTVADLALCIMARGVEIEYMHDDRPVLRFHEPVFDGSPLTAKSCGSWAWKTILDRLETQGFHWQDYLVTPGPVSPQVERRERLEALHARLSPEQRQHPILQDGTPWGDLYATKLRSKVWVSRYRNELASVGIETAADFALFVMVLGLRFWYAYDWGNCFLFARPTPDGQEVQLQTKSFGGWAWDATLGELKTRGFDWETFVVNLGELREKGKQ
jgi:hypothetical protein